jgi:hypothetical protein
MGICAWARRLRRSFPATFAWGARATTCLIVAASVLAVASFPAGADASWLAVPTPSTGSSLSYLDSVSCVSMDWCMAVGVSGSGNPLAELWDGSTWQILAVPDFNGESSSNQDVDLTGVSCVSESYCLAVGTNDETATDYDLAVAMAWNGSIWSSAGGTEPSMQDTYYNGVSCIPTDSCVAVGDIEYEGPKEIIDAYNDNAATAGANPGPFSSAGGGPSGPDLIPEGVSCADANLCMVVAQDFNPSGYSTIEWNGTDWATVETSTTGTLSSVSCYSDTFCLAAGGTLVQEWNGTAWSTISTTDVAGDDLNAVSCDGPTSCTLAGSDGTQSLVESWDGSSFAPESVPSYDAFDELEGISCVGEGQCMAVGTGGDSEGVSESTLAETDFPVPPGDVLPDAPVVLALPLVAASMFGLLLRRRRAGVSGNLVGRRRGALLQGRLYPPRRNGSRER